VSKIIDTACPQSFIFFSYRNFVKERKNNLRKERLVAVKKDGNIRKM